MNYEARIMKQKYWPLLVQIPAAGQDTDAGCQVSSFLGKEYYGKY